MMDRRNFVRSIVALATCPLMSLLPKPAKSKQELFWESGIPGITFVVDKRKLDECISGIDRVEIAKAMDEYRKSLRRHCILSRYTLGSL